MSVRRRKTKKLLERALIDDGKMEYALYEYELEELLNGLSLSMNTDKDDYIFAVTEHSSDVAMVLMEKQGKIYINEEAREKLKILWKDNAYIYNMKKMIPFFVKQLNNGKIPINGVRLTKDIEHKFFA